MSKVKVTEERQLHYDEIYAKSISGMFMLILNIVLMIGALAVFIYGLNLLETGKNTEGQLIYIVLAALYLFLIGPFLFAGLKILQPNEALVLTLFGKYHGTLKGEGFYFVNPFATAFNPTASALPPTSVTPEQTTSITKKPQGSTMKKVNKKISLKSMTLNNEKQKINDELGNPIIIGIVVIWRVVNTAKAAFNVDNYTEFLSIQCDSSLRNIVSLYPYDSSGDDDGEKSLRGSSQEVAEKLKDEIQSRVEIAGLEILEARITHLAYAPEIAAAMLQRQQASAIIAARQMIVEGAVGMVEMALSKLNENDIVKLDEERKAAMVSNLLVVLCGNKDAQPIVNSGSLY
ncbi:MAG: SPFH domain-containing protein [Parabacteroides sp.]|nr:SPFH domain-containing protein [Parabacteroides sp.]